MWLVILLSVTHIGVFCLGILFGRNNSKKVESVIDTEKKVEDVFLKPKSES